MHQGTSTGARALLSTATILLTSLTVAAARLPREDEFRGSLSREALESYLSRSVTFAALLHGRGNPEDHVRFLESTGAKFAGRAIYVWGGESRLEPLLETARPIAERIHRTDAEVVLQAAAFEIITRDVSKLPVPAWVFEEFDLPPESRNFRYEEMIYPQGHRLVDHWRRGASVPDMSRLETRMWFFYLAARYIEVGVEAIHFGQVELMDHRDPEHVHWRDMLRRVRAYGAEHGRRRFLICDAHVPSGGIVHDGELMFDFHSFPLRIDEVTDHPRAGVLKVGYLDSIFGRSRGGRTPSGWSCEHLPYLVELDNFGSSGRGGQNIGGHWCWGWDEICWFAHQEESYRDLWLWYAWEWVREHDSSGFFQMPASRTLADPVGDRHWYFAHSPSAASPDGFGQEATIRAIWKRAEQPPEPLEIRAWIKDGSPRRRETRTLEHLPGFRVESSGEQPATPTDRFGGWTRGPLEATGFFYPKRIDGRWWLIDPVGHRFLHLAVNSVRMGRGPQMRRAFSETYGTPPAWREATAKLLREHGFNGTGCWSDDEALAAAKQRLVYTPTLRFMSTYGKKRGGVVQLAGHKGYPNRCIFVFDPEFEEFAFEHARQVAARKDDPWLLGYFSDNEMPFPRDSLDRYLQLPEDDPGRREAAAWLRRRRGPEATPADISGDDRGAWLGHVADRYFGIVSRALKAHDPNHLYLGSRFYGSEKSSRDVLRAAGRHVDVISINAYGVWTPTAGMLERWSEWSGRPLLITEWYAKGADSGLANETGAGWTVPTQEDRGRFYQNFTLGLLESRSCVGWHWFKYQDNDPSDPSTDPSNRNSNKGILSAAYEPYAPLLERMKKLNQRAYALTAYFDWWWIHRDRSEETE